MRRTENHVEAAILRAIAAEAGIDMGNREKPFMIVEEVRSVDWASATFIGARHRFDLRIEGEDGAVAQAVERLVSGLPEREIPIIGHIVAEIFASFVKEGKQYIKIGERRLTVNALTIAD